MDARESKTLDAARRLIKSKLRHYVYDQRRQGPSRDVYERMLILERAILEEAQGQWLDALSEWDLQSTSARFWLQSLIGEVFYQSLRDVAKSFDGAEEGVVELLTSYAHQPWWEEVLPPVAEA